MKGFFSGIWLGFKALVTKPIEYLTNPIGTTTEIYKKDLEKEGASPAEIDAAVAKYQESGGPIYGLYSGLKGLSKGLSDLLTFTFKNLPAILLLAGVLVLGWYLLRLKKAVEV